MSDPVVQELVDQMAGAQRKLLAQLEGISEKELYTLPREGEWSAMKVLAHIMEMQPTWMGKVHKMMDEDDPLVDRTEAEWEQRPAEVEAHAADTLEQARHRLRHINTATLEGLRALQPEHLGRVGHRGGGTRLTVRELITTIIIQHLEAHAQQIAAARRAITSPSP